MLPVKHVLQLYIQSQTADPAPPLGTVLGNVGVNTVNFCKDFNNATASLPAFYTVCVRVEVYSNRTYSFEILPPTVNCFVGLLSKTLPTPKGRKGIYRTIRLRQVVLLARWKFPQLPLTESMPILCGTLASSRVLIC